MNKVSNLGCLVDIHLDAAKAHLVPKRLRPETHMSSSVDQGPLCGLRPQHLEMAVNVRYGPKSPIF